MVCQTTMHTSAANAAFPECPTLLMCPLPSPALPCPALPCALLQVVFHLQTRTPAVLPPLCELFGAAPGSARPMQDHALPDWRLLQVGSADVGSVVWCGVVW